MGDTHISHLVDKSSNIYFIWTKNIQYPIYWFASTYASSMLLAQVIFQSYEMYFITSKYIGCIFINKIWSW